eukprot:scaffold8186_cov96-Isochrysis_galbana.AAC.2
MGLEKDLSSTTVKDRTNLNSLPAAPVHHPNLILGGAGARGRDICRRSAAVATCLRETKLSSASWKTTLRGPDGSEPWGVARAQKERM